MMKHIKKLMGGTYKICSICNEWFPCNEEYFYMNNSNGMDGLHTYCKKCTITKAQNNMDLDKQRERVKFFYRTRQRTRDLRKAVMDKRRKEGKHREWQRNNPDKLKGYANKRSHKQHDINKQEWDKCKQYFNNECAYCGITNQDAKEKYNNYLHKDHADHEGANDLSNCVPACKCCNGSKYNFELMNWYNEGNINFTQDRMDRINKWLKEDYKLYIINDKKKKAVKIAISNYVQK